MAGTTASAACAAKTAPGIGRFGDCHMPAEFAQLPTSGDLAVTQYAFDDTGRPSGRISVLDDAGHPLASYAYPPIVLADGTSLAVHPREIDADPLGTAGDERFVVIFDAESGAGVAGDPPSPGALQEFRFDAHVGTIVPTSAPVLSGDVSSSGQKLGFETAQYDAGGALWAAQSLVGTLQAGPLAIYHRAAGSASVLGDRPSCGASAAWRGQAWGRVCAPDERITAATPLGIGRSLNEDTATGTMLLTTMSGDVLPVAANTTGGAGAANTSGAGAANTSGAGGAGAGVAAAAGTGGAASHAAGAPVNLGLDRLADRDVAAIGPRKAVLDTASRTLWVPIQQLATTRTCAAWPCTPTSLDQWLYAVDLAQLLGPATRPASASRPR